MTLYDTSPNIGPRHGSHSTGAYMKIIEKYTNALAGISRLAGHLRVEKDRRQRLLYLNPNPKPVSIMELSR